MGCRVTIIGNSAFALTGLTSVTFPASVTNIGNYAFEECNQLTNVTIPASVTSIGDGAFPECFTLRAITVDTNNSAYISVAGVLFNKSQTALIQYPAGKVGISYTTPGSVTKIGDYAFEGCNHLTTVTIPASVTNIGDYAFDCCSSLTSVYFPGNAPTADSLCSFATTTDGLLFAWHHRLEYSFCRSAAVLWNPLIQTSDGSFGVQNNQFGFNITGTPNIPDRGGSLHQSGQSRLDSAPDPHAHQRFGLFQRSAVDELPRPLLRPRLAMNVQGVRFSDKTAA